MEKKKGKKNGGNNLKQLLEGNISKNFFLEYRCVEWDLCVVLC